VITGGGVQFLVFIVQNFFSSDVKLAYVLSLFPCSFVGSSSSFPDSLSFWVEPFRRFVSLRFFELGLFRGVLESAFGFGFVICRGLVYSYGFGGGFDFS
jgi:hypothetical protein